MGEYWYFLNTEYEDYQPIKRNEETARIWVLVSVPRKTGDRIELKDTLGYIERIHNGEWLCFVKDPRRRTVKCIGGEPSAKEAKKRVIHYVRGALESSMSST